MGHTWYRVRDNVQDTGYSIQATGYGIHDTGCREEHGWYGVQGQGAGTGTGYLRRPDAAAASDSFRLPDSFADNVFPPDSFMPPPARAPPADPPSLPPVSFISDALLPQRMRIWVYRLELLVQRPVDIIQGDTARRRACA